MSYHYSKYEFVGLESDLERYNSGQRVLRAYWYVSTEFSVGTIQVGCPGWMLRAGPRAAARARTSGI